MRQIVCVVIVLSTAQFINCNSTTLRKTANGPVKGIELISSLGQKYYAFKGIPFAETPITGIDPHTGEQVDRRFKAPEPLQRKWTDTLTVDKFADFCIPRGPFEEKITPEMSEDCLFLNIYVPVNGRTPKTVLVWIHGGGFIEGDASDSWYGPDFLLSADNIVVTVQYRLGIFGFLSLGSGEYTGNMGLKDQQVALKWIHENIENFWGNKNEILLFGQSAGATSVNFQMLNEESRKYFNRAFISSSSAFSYYGYADGNHFNQIQECSQLEGKEKLIEFLKTADIKALVECQSYTFESSVIVPWAPTIENACTIGAFKTQSPDEMYDAGNAPVMDAMFSFNSEEFIPFQPSLVNSTEPLIKENLIESMLPLPFDGFNGKNHPEEYKQALQVLKDAYYPQGISGDAITRENINLMSDMYFGDTILKAAVLQAKANNKDVDRNKHKNTFLFRFSVDADLNFFKLMDNLVYNGTGHSDDLCYVFHFHVFNDRKVYDKAFNCEELGLSCVSYNVIKRMAKFISNFARTGNPSIEGDIPFKNSRSSDQMFCHEISNDPQSSLTTNIKEQQRFDAWREVEAIYKKLKIVSGN